MTSGVYQFTFPSGKTYIGKSIDIESRWKQHYDKLCSGKAAKLLQDEWDKCGYADRKVLCECHPDHVDIMEAVFICRNKPALNTTIPADPMLGMNQDEINDVFKWLDESTVSHTRKLNTLSTEISKRDKIIESQDKIINTLGAKRSNEEINTEIGKKYLEASRALKREISVRKETVKNLETKIASLEGSWWNRLFN